MKCKQTQLLLSDFEVGRLRADAEAEMRSHLDHCVDCARALELSRQTMHIVESYIPLDPPADLWKRVEERLAVRERRQTQWVSWQKGWSSPRRWSWALAAVVLIGLMTIHFKPRHAPEQPTLPDVASTFLQQHSFTNAYDPFANQAAWGTLIVAAYRKEVTR